MLSIDKIKKGLKNPRLAIAILVERFFKKDYEWRGDNTSGLKKKIYGSYAEYVRHQRRKLPVVKDYLLENYDEQYRGALLSRLNDQKIVEPGMRVLCLAAGIGSEVKSFLDLGCFAVGIDLNPGTRNKYVVYGDFHEIQYRFQTVDVVFSNSLDHVFDIDRLIKEIKRVLKPGGFLILEILKGEEEGCSPKDYESLHWQKVEDLLELFSNSGFKVIGNVDFEFPWRGQHVSLALRALDKPPNEELG